MVLWYKVHFWVMGVFQGGTMQRFAPSHRRQHHYLALRRARTGAATTSMTALGASLRARGSGITGVVDAGTAMAEQWASPNLLIRLKRIYNF
jgi:hypothetical protein